MLSLQLAGMVHAAGLLVNGRPAVRIRSPAPGQGGKHPRHGHLRATDRGTNVPATSPDDVVKVIAEARTHSGALGPYLWLVAVTGMRCGELCGLQIRDFDPDRGLVHVAFNYVVATASAYVRTPRPTRTAGWPSTHLDEIRVGLAAVAVELRDDAYLFSDDPAHSRPWNPDWATRQVAEAAAAAG